MGGIKTIQSQLDRALASKELRITFLKSSVVHLRHIYSDHYPNLVKVAKYVTLSYKKPFRFEVAWISYPNFKKMVLDSWNKVIGSVTGDLLAV